MSKILPM